MWCHKSLWLCWHSKKVFQGFFVRSVDRTWRKQVDIVPRRGRTQGINANTVFKPCVLFLMERVALQNFSNCKHCYGSNGSGVMTQLTSIALWLTSIDSTWLYQCTLLLPNSPQIGCLWGSGGRAIERRTVNRVGGGSIPPTAVSKLRQFRSPHICLCLSEETLKAGGPLYLVFMPGEVKDHRG